MLGSGLYWNTTNCSINSKRRSTNRTSSLESPQDVEEAKTNWNSWRKGLGLLKEVVAFDSEMLHDYAWNLTLKFLLSSRYLNLKSTGVPHARRII